MSGQKIPPLVAAKEVVLLLARGRKHGVPVLKEDYLLVRDFILEILKRKKEITLTYLIECATLSLMNKISGDLGWYILNVKQDMESRNLIAAVRSEGKRRVQLIRLKRQRPTLLRKNSAVSKETE
jgi:hypothetical protein